jgi:hypothetical protein
MQNGNRFRKVRKLLTKIRGSHKYFLLGFNNHSNNIYCPSLLYHFLWATNNSFMSLFFKNKHNTNSSLQLTLILYAMIG